jgi:hypothetical protein
VFREILTDSQQSLLELLSRLSEVKTFYLARGTALALHLGHRRSRDFDFFRDEDFWPQDLLGRLREAGEAAVLQETTGTLSVMLRAMPEMLRPLSWDHVKGFFRAEANRLFRSLP